MRQQGRAIVSNLMFIKRGFTLIELLVVISIIGLIATIALVATNNARIRGRDTKRLTDMRALHQAMEVCNDSNNGSYVSPTVCCLGWTASPDNDNAFQCLGGLVTAMPNIVTLTDPSKVAASVDCASSGNTAPCEYTFAAAPTANTYTVYFYLEGNGGQTKTLTHLGIQ